MLLNSLQIIIIMSGKVQFCPKCHQPLDGACCPFCGYDVSTGTTVAKGPDSKQKSEHSELLYAVALLIFIAASIAIGYYYL
jgi:predicted amidophosphoribosyltransferase